MIGVIFNFGTEIVEVSVSGKNVYFRTNPLGGYATIDKLKLSKAGAIRQFPDLKNKENWKELSIKRFKKKINNLQTEDERVKYLITDLEQHGYKAKAIQKTGFRPKRIS